MVWLFRILVLVHTTKILMPYWRKLVLEYNYMCPFLAASQTCPPSSAAAQHPLWHPAHHMLLLVPNRLYLSYIRMYGPACKTADITLCQFVQRFAKSSKRIHVALGPHANVNGSLDGRPDMTIAHSTAAAATGRRLGIWTKKRKTAWNSERQTAQQTLCNWKERRQWDEHWKH